MTAADYTYHCKRLEAVTETAWEHLPGVVLVKTESGGEARLHTVLKACWTGTDVCFRFECEDDHVVAHFAKRDDPLYDEDVVEIFLDEAGDGRHYKELEISPRNVLFDALIANDLAGSIVVDTVWNAAGIRTSVQWTDDNRYVYDVAIPHTVFDGPPQPGIAWKANFYRIDEDREGSRHFWAWSPTGAVNYHLPHRFGRLVFV